MSGFVGWLRQGGGGWRRLREALAKRGLFFQPDFDPASSLDSLLDTLFSTLTRPNEALSKAMPEEAPEPDGFGGGPVSMS